MKTNLNKTTYFDITKGEEINELIKNGEDIKDQLEIPFTLLKANKYQLYSQIEKHIAKGDIVLLYDEKSVRSYTRMFKDLDKNKVYVNVSPFARKEKEGYAIDSIKLYSLLLGAMVTLYHEDIVRDRNYVSKNMDIYLEFMTKFIASQRKNFNYAKNESFKYHFIMSIFYLYKNKTKIFDIYNYAIKISEITKEDADVLMVKYDKYLNEKNKDNLTYEDLLENVLKKEFAFLNDKTFTKESIINSIHKMYGGFMVYMIEEMSIIGTLMMNYVVKGSNSLLDKSVYKGLVSPNDTNEIITTLAKISKY